MLEKYISSLLVPYLSKYAENIDAKQLNISIWSGSASLKNLVLRPEFVEALDLPLKLHRGVCKNIQFNIPVKNINSKPIEVEISQLLLCLVSTLDKPTDKRTAVERQVKDKELALERFESERKQKAAEAAAAGALQEESSGGMVSRLSERVINNVIVNIKSVHVRIEDTSENVIFGAVLGGVRLVTVNDQDQVEFVDPAKLTETRKMLQFSGVESYCEEQQRASSLPAGSNGAEPHDGVFLSRLPTNDAWEEGMLKRITQQQLIDCNKNCGSTIFGPASGSVILNLVMQQHLKAKQNQPYAQARVKLENVVSSFSHQQYQALLTMASKFGSWKTLQPLALLRERVNETAVTFHLSRAQRHWIFVKRAVQLVQVRALTKIMRVRSSAACVGDYKVLYAQHVRSNGQLSTVAPVDSSGNAMKPSPAAVYRFCLQQMSVVDLIAARKEVYQKLASDLAAHREERQLLEQQAAKVKQEEKKKAGFFGGFFGGGSSKPAEAAASDEPSWEDIEKEYGLDGVAGGAVDTADDYQTVKASLPKDFKWLSVVLEMPSCGVTLRFPRSHRTQSGGYGARHAALRFQNIRAGFDGFNATGSYGFSISADDMMVSHPDAASTNTERVVPPIVSQATRTAHSNSTTTTALSQGAPSYLFSVSAVIQPPTQRVAGTTLDADIAVELRPLRVCVDPVTVKEFVTFFEVPAELNISALTTSAKQFASRAQGAATSSISNAFLNSKNVAIRFDASAPLFIVPRSLQSSDEAAICVSLGRIRLHNDPLSDAERSRRAKLVELGPDQYSSDILYAVNSAQLSDMYVTLSTVGCAVRDSRSGFTLLSEITVDAAVSNRVVPSATHAEAVRVSADAPLLRLAASVHQTYRLVTIYENWRQELLLDSLREEQATALPISSLPDSPGFLVRDAVTPVASATPTDFPSTPQGSQYSTTVASSSAPKLAVSLSVVSVEVALHHDAIDATDALPWCTLAATPLQLSLATIAEGMALGVHIARLSCAQRDGALVLGGGSSVRYDHLSAAGQPTKLTVEISSGLTLYFGTPVMEITEFVLDAVNLLFPARGRPAAGGVVAAMPTYYQPLVSQDEAQQETPTMIIAVRIASAELAVQTRDGRIKPQRNAVDLPFATAEASGVAVTIELLPHTLRVFGGVADVQLHIAADALRLPLHGSRPLLCGLKRSSAEAPLVSFSYYTLAVSGPDFVDDAPQTPSSLVSRAAGCGSSRRVRNADTCGFSKVCEVHVGAVQATFDMHTIMLLLKYFMEGYFVRITQVADRPRYDGTEIPRPLSAPPTLMKLIVRVAGGELVAPVNPLSTHKCLVASLGELVIDNALDLSAVSVTTNIRLKQLAISTDGDAPKELLMPTNITVALHNCFDPLARREQIIAVSSTQLSIKANSSELVDIVDFTAGNILRMPFPDEVAAIRYDRSEYLPSLLSNRLATSSSRSSSRGLDLNSTANAAKIEEVPGVVVEIRFGSILIDLFSGTRTPHLSLGVAELLVELMPQQHQKLIAWRAAVIHDVRGGEQLCLLNCTSSSVAISSVPPTIALGRSESGGDIVESGAAQIVDQKALSGDKEGVLTTLIEIALNVDRLAVSDQWLDVYDYFVNEAVMKALSPLTSPAPRESPADGILTNEQPNGGLLLRLSAKQFVLPLLTVDRKECFVTTVSRFAVAVENGVLGRPTNVSIEVASVVLKHVSTNSNVLFCSITEPSADEAAEPQRVDSATSSFIAALASSTAAASKPSLTSPSSPGGNSLKKSTSAPQDLHASLLRIDLTATTNVTKIFLRLVGLNAVVCVPILNELVHYCTHPAEAVAKISQLGVMKEERARVAALAAKTASATAIEVRVDWSQPVVILHGNAMDMSDTSHNIEVCLGELSTQVVFNKSQEFIQVIANLERISIPRGSVLRETDLGFAFTSNATEETIEARLSKANVSVFPQLLEDLMWVLQANVLLADSQQGSSAPAPVRSENADRSIAVTAPPSAVAKKRRIKFDSASGLEATVWGTDEKPFLSLSWDCLAVSIDEQQSIHAYVSGVRASELPSGTPMLTCGASSNSSSASPQHSVEVSLEGRTTRVAVADTSLTLLPRAIGGLSNIALSVKGPKLNSTTAPRHLPSAAASSDNVLSPSTAADTLPSMTLITVQRSSVSLIACTNTPSATGGASQQQQQRLLSTFSVDGATMCLSQVPPAAGICRPTSVVEVIISALRAEDKQTTDTLYRFMVQPDAPLLRDEQKSNNATALEASASRGARVSLRRLSHWLVTHPWWESDDPYQESSASDAYLNALTPDEWSLLSESLPQLAGKSRNQCPLSASALYIAVSRVVEAEAFVHVRLSRYDANQANTINCEPYTNATSKRHKEHTFTQHLYGRVASVAVVLVPSLMADIMHSVQAVTSVVSDTAHTRARELAAERASSLRNDESPLTLFDVVVHRPRAVAVSRATSRETLEFFPGEFTLHSRLQWHNEFQCSEVYSVQVDGLEVRINSGQCFQNKKCIALSYAIPLRSRQEASTSATPIKRALSLSIPSLDMTLSQSQMVFVFDITGQLLSVVGAMPDFLNDDADPLLDEKGRLLVGGAQHDDTPSAPLQPSHRDPPEQLSSDGELEATFQLKVLHVNIASVFTANVRGVRLVARLNPNEKDDVDSQQNRKSSKRVTMTTLFELEAISLSHYDAYVIVPVDDANRLAETAGTSSHRDPTIQIFYMSGASIKHTASHGSVDDDTQEQMLDVTVQRLSAAVTPRAVADCVTVLYDPFGTHVLSRPLRPITVIRLEHEHTLTLSEDVVLDDKHLMVAHNHTLRTYEVNLNGHRLILKGSPRPLITLQEGCEVLFRNGKIFVTGAYSLNSFVKFGLHTKLRLDSTASIAKRLYNATVRQSLQPHDDEQHGEGRRLSGSGSLQAVHHQRKDTGEALTFQQRTVRPGVSFPRTGSQQHMSSPQKHGLQKHRDPEDDGRVGALVVSSPTSPHPPVMSQLLMVTLNVCCDVHLISNDYQLDIGVVTKAGVTYTRRSTGARAEQQNLRVVLESLRTLDDRTLQPTTVEAHLTGVDVISLRLNVRSLETYVNIMHLKRMMSVASELTNAFFGENSSAPPYESPHRSTGHREVASSSATTSSSDTTYFFLEEYEDDNGLPLRETKLRGACRYCRSQTAVLAHESNQVGFACWRCTTGHVAVLGSAVEAQVELINVVLATAKGEMLELRGDGINVTRGDDKQLTTQARLQVNTFNRKFSSWEPLVEQSVIDITFSPVERKLAVLFEKCQTVFSLDAVSLVTALVADFQSPADTSDRPTTESHIQVKHRLTRCVIRNKLFEPVVVVLSAADLANNSGSNVQIAAQQAADVVLLEPHIRLVRVSSSDPVPFAIDRSAHFSTMGADVVVEATATVAADGLSRVVDLVLYPVHCGTLKMGTFIGIRNLLTIPLHVLSVGAHIPAGDTLFLPSHTTLTGTFHVVPMCGVGDETYGVSETSGNYSPPSIFDILNGYEYKVTSSSKKNPNNQLHMKLTRRHGDSIGGVPSHLIVVEGAIQVHNALPCPVEMVFYKSLSSNSAAPEELETVVVPANGSAHTMRIATVDAVHAQIAVHTNKQSTGGPRASTVFTAAPSQLRSRTLTLSSAAQQGDVLTVQLSVVGDRVTVSSPYAIVNHTPFELELMDYSAAGKLVSSVMSKRAKNYYKLPPSMVAPVPAQPDDDKVFFVSMRCTHPASKSEFVAEELPFHVPGVVSQISLVCDKSTQVMNLVFLTSVTSSGTRVVQIAPRWVMVNRTPRPLYVAQQLTVSAVTNVIMVPPHSAAPFVLTTRPSSSATQNQANPVGVHVRVSQHERVSPGVSVPVEEIGNVITVAQGNDPVQQPDVMIDVAVSNEDPYMYVVLEEPSVPPFLFYNRCGYAASVSAAATKRELCTAQPFHCRQFAFERAVAHHQHEEEQPAASGVPTSRQQQQEVLQNLAALQHSVMVTVCGVSFDVSLRRSRSATSAPVVHCIPLDNNQTIDLCPRLSTGSRGQTILELIPLLRDDDYCVVPAPTNMFDAVLNIKSLSTSICHKQQEITFGLFEDLRAHLKRVEYREIFNLSVNGFQFDNQVEERPKYEACLSATRRNKDQCAISMYVERTIVQAPSVVHVDEIRVDVAPLALRISDAWLLALLSLVEDISAGSSSSSSSAALLNGTACPTLEALYTNSPKAAGWLAAQMHIERIVVNPVVLRVWFLRSGGKDIIRQQLKHRQAATVISLMVGAVEDVAVTAPGITAANENRRVQLQIRRFTDFYVAGFKRQLVGLGFQFASSLPLIGVPIRLVSDVSSGAVMFFKEPIEGLVDSPKAFALGLARGSVGLLGNVLGGGFNAVSSVASTTANVARMASGTSSQEHQRANTLTGLVSGVTGLVTKPMQGYAENGGVGLLKGIGQGILGAAAAPVSGLLSDVSKAATATANVLSDKYIPEVRRVRQIRLFHASGAIAPFGTLAESTQYQRRPHGDFKYLDDLLPTDGPLWSPKPREQLQAELRFPADRWAVATYGATLDGWTYGERYDSVDFGTRIHRDTHVRKRRWVAVVSDRGAAASTHSRAAPPALPRRSNGTVDVTGTAPSNLSIVNMSLASRPPIDLELTTSSQQSTETTRHRHSNSEPPVAAASPGIHTETRLVETFENQRKYPIKGWSSSLMPTDRAKWSSRDGRHAQPLDSFALELGWDWDGDWEVYKSTGTDANGWTYATDFPSNNYTARESLTDFVRRRCWRRMMKRVLATVPSPGSTQSSSHFFSSPQ